MVSNQKETTNGSGKRMVLKVLVMLLIISLTYTNISIISNYLGDGWWSYATGIDLNNQDNSTNVDNVKFDVYLDMYNMRAHTMEKDLNSDDLVVYVRVSVQGGGVLNDGAISFGDTNFKLQDAVDGNEIGLDTIASGQAAMIGIPISFIRGGDQYNVELLDMISSIRLTGKYTNNDGKVIDVGSEKYVRVIWDSSDNSEESSPIILSQEIITNKVFEIDGENKRVIQVSVKSGIENNIYPIKETNIEIEVPSATVTETVETIDEVEEVEEVEEITEVVEENEEDDDVFILGDEEREEEVVILGNPAPKSTVNTKKILPEIVQVSIVNGTNATNGRTIIEKVQAIQGETTKSNIWAYDENGRMNIKSTNLPNDSNNILWSKSGVDEYIITYVYPEDADISAIELEAKSNISLYSNNNSELSARDVINMGDTGEISNVVSFDMTVTDKAYKSNMKMGANIDYMTRWSIGVSYAPVIDEVIMMDHRDALSNEDGTMQYHRSAYKTSYVDKSEFINIYGVGGNIGIYDVVTNQLLYIINGESETDAKGDIVIEYPANIYNIYLKTSNPLSEGRLNIYTNKVILPGLASAEIDGIDRLISTAVVASNTEEKQVEAIMQLENTVTLSRLGLNRTTLSTTQANDVTLTLTLKTDDLKYDLYANAIFEVEMPSYIREVNVKDVQLLNGRGLELIPFEGVRVNESENKEIRLGLAGSQTSYGADTIISIKTQMVAEEFMPSVDTEIKLTYTNGRETTYANGTNTDKVGISIQAQSGMILGHSASNYAGVGTEISAIKSGKKAGQLEANAEAQLATITGAILNNTDNTGKNITVLGRIPAKGNTTIESGEDLGTTINTTLRSTISVLNKNGGEVDVTVYYSDNEDATQDLNDEENGWIEQARTTAKSYLIVIESIEVKEIVEFKYNIEIPANLSKNQEAYTAYGVYNGSDLTESPVLGLETQKQLNPEDVKIEIISSADTNNVHEGERITFSAKITNESETDLKNITVTLPIPGGTTYVKWEQVFEEDEYGNRYYGHYQYNEYPEIRKLPVINIPVIKAGETWETEEYEVQVNDMLDGQEINDIEYTVLMTIEGLEEEIKETKEYIANIATVKSEMIFAHSHNVLFVNDIRDLSLTMLNVSGQEIKNIEFSMMIPEEMEYKGIEPVQYTSYKDGIGYFDREVEAKTTYNKDNRILTCKIEDLGIDERLNMAIFVKGNPLPSDKTKNEVMCIGNVKADEMETHRLSPVKVNIENVSVEISDVSNVENNTVLENDTIPYKIRITNNSSAQIDSAEIVLELPEGVQYVNTTPYRDSHEDNTIIWMQNQLHPGETREYKVNVYAELLEDGVRSRTVDFQTQMNVDVLEDDIRHSSTYTIDRRREDPEEPEGPEEPRTYSISGEAWLDSNRNGKKDQGEKLLKDIGVKLKNADTNEMVKNAAGREVLVKTNDIGKYTFEDIISGNYIAIFEFDYNTYEVTIPNLESKATTADLDGKSTTYADIVVSNRDVTDINIGLTLKPVFNLEMETYISKITVQNQDGTEVNTYDKQTGKLAKVDIRARYLPATMVIIEYTLEVTNKGDIPGYATNIANYIAPDLNFNSDMNTQWYEGTDGVLYSNALEKEEIKPGESKTLKLTLTKAMTSNNVGLTNNTAELLSTNNEQAIVDVNKTNKKSSADVITAVRTGSAVMYISIIMLCIGMLGRRSIHH